MIFKFRLQKSDIPINHPDNAFANALDEISNDVYIREPFDGYHWCEIVVDERSKQSMVDLLSSNNGVDYISISD